MKIKSHNGSSCFTYIIHLYTVSHKICIHESSQGTWICFLQFSYDRKYPQLSHNSDKYWLCTGLTLLPCFVRVQRYF